MKKRILFLTVMLLSFLAAGAQKYTYEIGDKVSDDNGNYQVVGANLIPNPTFDEGTTGWIAGNGTDLSDSNFEVVPDGGPDGGACLKALGGAGSGDARSIKTGWPIQPGHKYLFSCWARRTASGMSSNTQYSRIFLGTSATSTSKEISTVKYQADKWVQTTLIFDADDYTYCVCNLGWLNSASQFDCFNLVEVTATGELNYAKLEAAIADGKYRLESTEEGTGKGQYTAQVRQTLQAAIAEAEAAMASATTQEQVKSAVETLNAAIQKYTDSVNPPFVTGVQYNLVHSSGYLLSSGGNGGTVKIVEADVNDKTQVFTFCLVPEGSAASGYNIRDAEGNYIYRSGSWDTKASETQDITIANAIFQMVEGNGYVQLKNMGSGSVLGTDNNNAGSTVYSNKNGTDARYRWTLVEYVPADQRDAQYNYEQLLAKAQKEYGAIPLQNVGTHLFQYSQQAYDAYGQAIATSQTMTADWQAALDYLQQAMDAFARDAMNNPSPTQPYIITQSSGSVLAYDAEQTLGVLQNPDYGTAQQFRLIVAETAGAFYLQNIQSGRYLAKSGSSAWNTCWEDAMGSATAQWIIHEYDETYLTLQNVSGRGYLGSDATEAGSLLYCDKSASAQNSHWTITEYTVAGALNSVIAEAQLLADNTPVGTDYTSVPQRAMDELNAAIAEAIRARDTLTDFVQAQQAADALVAAMEKFRDSFNQMTEFESGIAYKIIHYGGSVLTYTATGNATITALDEDSRTNENQEIILEQVEGRPMTYYLRAANGRYLANNGDYNTQWQEGNEAGAMFIIEHLTGGYVGLHNTQKAYYGTDATTSGAAVYSDKASSSNLAYWTIEAVINWDYTLYNTQMAAAREYAASMQEGYMPGQYFAHVIAQMTAALNESERLSKRAASQEALDAMAAELETLVAEYKAKANATNRADEYLSILAQECQTEAEAVTIGVDRGTYTQANKDAFVEAIAQARATTEGYEAAIVALQDARDVFRAAVNSIDRAALKAAIDAAQKSTDEAVTGDCDGQYPVQAVEAFKLTLQEAGATYNDITRTQEQVDAAVASLKEAASAFAAARVAVDFAALRSTVSDAQKTISDNEKFRGEGAGTYPDSAFDALQQALAQAQAVVGSKSHNQAAVDAERAALEQAIVDFESSWVPNDYTQLSALLSAARELLEGSRHYMHADDIEELEYAIGVGEEAMKSNEQTVIDRAVKILNRDYQLYKSIADAVESIAMGAETLAAFYTLDGQRVMRPTKGVYIIRVGNASKKIMIK